MNPRITKEIRMQMPVLAFVVAGLLFSLHLERSGRAFYDGVYGELAKTIMIGVYILGCLIMGAIVFGNEFQHRTWAMLMSQPIARRTIWREKMAVLVASCGAIFLTAVLVALFAIMLSSKLSLAGLKHAVAEEPWPLGWMVFVVIGVACTTPYLTLAARSSIGGIVFSICCPAILYMIATTIWDRLEKAGISEAANRPWSAQLVYVILLIPYVALFYWLGRRKFMRMEVIDSQSQEISLPTVFEMPFDKLFQGVKGPFARLMLKELRLQRMSLLITAIFCGLVLFEFLLRKINPAMEGSYFGATVGIYLAVFSVIVGVTAVAEEKSWGMKDWHLTLPPSVRQQWGAKWRVALGISLLLGTCLASGFTRINPWGDEVHIDAERFASLLMFGSLVTVVAMYAASLSATNMRALMLTMGLVVVFMGAFFAMANTDSEGVSMRSVIISMVAVILSQILWVMWNLIVCPVWWFTHSIEKTSHIARWADRQPGSGNLTTIFMTLYLCAGLWLILRFARANYRRGDLMKGKIWKQFTAMVFLAVIFGATFNIATHSYYQSGVNMPQWTLFQLYDAPPKQ